MMQSPLSFLEYRFDESRHHGCLPSLPSIFVTLGGASHDGQGHHICLNGDLVDRGIRETDNTSDVLFHAVL
jgi:hypothetical protein